MRAARRADRRHAHKIFSDAAEREAEWRMNQTPCKQEHQKQHGKRVAESSLAIQIKTEMTEKLPGMNALQAVHAAGQPAETVGEFGQQQAETKREHDQRKMAKPADDKARRVADQSS